MIQMLGARVGNIGLVGPKLKKKFIVLMKKFFVRILMTYSLIQFFLFSRGCTMLLF